MKYILIFLGGGLAYNIIEYFWRGYSHWTMTIDGGLCFLGIILICQNMHINFIYKVLCSSLLITTVELVSGLIVNKLLNWQIWDYSVLPFNFMGQICLRYCLLWIAFSIPLVAIIQTFLSIK